MNDKLSKLLLIDQNIHYFVEENNYLSNSEFDKLLEKNDYINKAIKLLKKMNSRDLLEVIKRCEYLNRFIDFKKFIKKYSINKSFLRNNRELYIEEYRKLQKFCYYVGNISININEFEDYMNILDLDGIEKYLLKNMPNDQIYKLAMETTYWHEKLYFFSYFKKKDT